MFFKRETKDQREIERKDSNDSLMDSLKVGVAEVDPNHRIIRYNRSFFDMFNRSDSDADWHERLVRLDFYNVIGHLFFESGCYAPFHFVKKTQEMKTAILVNNDSPASGINLAYFGGENDSYSNETKSFELFVSPHDRNFLVEILDRSENAHLEKRMQVLKNAGAELMSTIDRKLCHLPVEEQKEELKQIITEHMRATLRYDVVEIRILGEDEVSLLPYLSFGVAPDNAKRVLKISSDQQGITGYVADTGQEYICNDTLNDPHYIEGAINARSSLTVPLIYDNQVTGVVNVERAGAESEDDDNRENGEPQDPKRRGKIIPFTQQDALFLKLYAKDLAFALHMLHFSQLQRDRAREFCADSIESNLREKLDDLFLLIHSLRSKLQVTDLACGQNDVTERCETAFGDLSESYVALKSAYENLIDFVKFASKEQIRQYQQLQADSKRITLEETLQQVSKGQSQKKLLETYREIKGFFFAHKSKFLIVSPQNREEIGFDQWLKELGARIDVAPSTEIALSALQRGDYDFVIIHKYGDGGPGVKGGLYFTREETSSENIEKMGVNSSGRSPIDIHRSGYFETIAGDDYDASLRQRVAQQLQNGERDAYFFARALIDLNLDKRPTCLFTTINGEYDGTHVYVDMNESLDVKVGKPFLLDNNGFPTATTFMTILAEAIKCRQAKTSSKSE